MKRVRVTARGNVQGVFFRDSTAREARAAGVAGWVTNRSDGAVEAVFEGGDAGGGPGVGIVWGGPGVAGVEGGGVPDEKPERHPGVRGWLASKNPGHF